MNRTSREPDKQALDALVAAATELLAQCDEQGLSLVAIDICAALEKLKSLQADCNSKG